MDSNSVWMVYLVMLVVGSLICFRGFRLYKLVQFLLCGWIGYFLTLQIGAKFSVEGTVLLVIALAAGLITGFLGFRYYKAGMYFSASISAFLVVFSFFWRQAMALGKTLLEQVSGAEHIFAFGNFFQTVLLGVKTGADVNLLELMLSETGIRPEGWSEGLEQIMSLLKQGVLWAAVAGLLCGILAVAIGDYVIIILTSVFGGMLLDLMVEQFIVLDKPISTVVMLIFSVLGIVTQIKRERQKG